MPGREWVRLDCRARSRLNVVVLSPIPFELGQNNCWPSGGSKLLRALPSFRLRCNESSLLLNSYLSRMLHLAPEIIRPRTPPISLCVVKLRTLCAARSLATLCLSTTSGPGTAELPDFWGSMVFRHAPNSLKGSGNKTTCIKPSFAAN